MQQPTNFRYHAGSTSLTEARSGLLARVAGLIAFSMAFTTAGAVVGVQIPSLGLIAMIGVLILSFAIGFARNVNGLNLVLLYALTTLMGVGLGGIIELYLRAGSGAVVIQAGLTTAVLTVGLAMYALTTKRDFSGIGSKLFLAMLALIVAGIVGIFIQATMLQVLIGLAGSIIFSLYLVYQVQQAKSIENTMPNAIMVAVGIYLSIINIFLSLLRLMTALNGSRN